MLFEAKQTVFGSNVLFLMLLSQVRKDDESRIHGVRKRRSQLCAVLDV